MTLSSMVRQLPLRLTAGAFMLNSGLSKRNADQMTANQLQDFAAASYPFLRKLDARTFARLLSTGEIVIGAALLAPFVPAAVAGIGLTAFSAGLVGMYLRIPGMREEGSLRPTQQGLALAKDVWMLGIGLSLLADRLTEPGE